VFLTPKMFGFGCTPYSFASVVLFLKVLLNQQGLDTPYTGGLGSYKLYVMVALHIQQHLAMGGADRPGEVLLTFLFRYGRVQGHNVDDMARTKLHQKVPLQYSTDCSADLSNVFLLDTIVQLFATSFSRLWKHVGILSQSSKTSSTEGRRPAARATMECLLMHLVDTDRLRLDRQECSNRTDKWLQMRQPTNSNELLVQGESTHHHSRCADTATAARSYDVGGSVSPSPSVQDRDKSAEELLAGYGVTAEEELEAPERHSRLKRLRVA
jgi:hypothetical protein